MAEIPRENQSWPKSETSPFQYTLALAHWHWLHAAAPAFQPFSNWCPLQQHRLLPCPQGHGVLAAAGVTSYHCRANRVKERDRKNSMYACLNTVLHSGEQGCASHPGTSPQSCITQPGQRETSSPASYLMSDGICSFPTFLSLLSLPPWLQDPLPAGH